MNEAIKINSMIIKCDFCAFETPIDDYAKIIDFVNQPCPDCGESLLTEEDYLATQQLIAVKNLINHIGRNEDGDHAEYVNFTLQTDTKGNLTKKEPTA